MKTVLHRADSRGFADHGWLKSHHTFSFAGYIDPTRMRFGLLRVLNDDIVRGGMGFGEHPHDNMEIVSIPLSGALAHKDSTGRSEVIQAGEVQIMSAGSGIRHSEFNHSSTDPVNFLQIWVFPKERNIAPRYAQQYFAPEGRQNKIQTVVSPIADSGGLWINQDAVFSLANADAGTALQYPLQFAGNGVYLFVLEGQIQIAGQTLHSRDAIGIEEVETIEWSTDQASQVLLIEVPMN